MTALSETLVGDDGPAVVFCHGLFGRGRNFSSIAKALLPDFRSVLLDMPAGTRVVANSFDMGDWEPDETAEVTDDCSAVERLGMTVKTVEGDERNLKVTTPMDLKIAELLLEETK